MNALSAVAGFLLKNQAVVIIIYKELKNQMGKRKPLNQGRLGMTFPVDHSLVKVLSNLREKTFQASSDRSRFILTGRDMLVLGRLINAWKDIVGIQLAHKTCPSRLIKGRLFLTVADSQWLQTLTFIKPRIIEKLAQRFPECKIYDIVGRPGKIPPEVEKLVSEAEWPDWHEVSDIDLPEKLDPELTEIIGRCRKKLLARIDGLKKRGLALCCKCEAAMTASVDGICAICSFESRKELIAEVKPLLREMPWLDYEEVLSFEADLKNYEYEALKSELLDECVEIIHELSEQLKEKFDETLFRQMKKEMIRAIMFHTGCMPDQVDLYHLETRQLLVPDWVEYLAMKPEEEPC